MPNEKSHFLLPLVIGANLILASYRPREEKRLDAIALREFYQRFGMEHLYELHEESTKFYQKY